MATSAWARTLIEWADGSGREVTTLRSIDSTQPLARRWLAETEEPLSAWVFALAQTAGQGRLGRTWVSPSTGGIYFSWARRARVGELPSLLPMRVAVGVCEAVSRLGLPARLKWPNDVLVQDAKLGGILMHAKRLGDAGYEFVAGVGINYSAEASEALDRPAWSLDQSPMALPSLGECSTSIAESVEEQVASPTFDLAAYRRWSVHSPGERLTVRTADREFEGRFLEFAEDGTLVLESEGRIERVSSGELM